MYATVVAVEDQDVILEVAPGVEARFMRRAIMDVVPDGTGPDFSDAPEDPVDEGPEDPFDEAPEDPVDEAPEDPADPAKHSEAEDDAAAG